MSATDLIPVGPGRQPRQRTFARGTGTPFETPATELTTLPAEPIERFGPYEIFEELGIGGMASVHRAEVPGAAGFRKPVALKRMLPHVASDPSSVRAFLEEARLASRLHHENIAQAYDVGCLPTEAGEDTYFIAMEMVPGPTLKQVIVQCLTVCGPIPVAIAVEILIQLCEALDHAHNLRGDDGRPLGIIHRDVSPSNVIVSASGAVKLIDFGIAKAERSAERTQTGVIKGKLGYLAPEYLQGQLDARADLFGLGVVAYELLTGRRLFHANNDYDIVQQVREKPIPRPSRDNPQITVALDDIVLLALERDPDKRWQSARAMQVALQNVARELGAGVSHRMIRDWTEWAFSQDSRSSIEIIRIVDEIDDALTGSAPLPYADTPIVIAPERARSETPTIYERPRSHRHPVVVREPRANRLAPWLVLLLMFGIAGVALYRQLELVLR